MKFFKMKMIYSLFLALISYASFAQMGEFEGLIRSSAGTPEIDLFDSAASENRVEGTFREANDNIFIEAYRGDLRLGATTTGGTDTKLAISGSNDRVGINTNSPQSALHVYSSSSSSDNARIYGGGINYYSGSSTAVGNIGFGFGSSQWVNSQTPGSNSIPGFMLFTDNTSGVNERRMVVSGDGDVGIGDFGPAGASVPTSVVELRHMIGTSPDFRDDGVKFTNTGSNARSFTFYVTNGSGNLELFTSVGGTSAVGVFNGASGSYSALSDARLKLNVKNIPSILSKVKKLTPVSYNFKSQKNLDKRYFGIMAQELIEDFPEVVNYDLDKDQYHVDYSSLGVIAIKAIQEQQKTIELLLDKIENLESEVSGLQSTTK